VEFCGTGTSDNVGASIDNVELLRTDCWDLKKLNNRYLICASIYYILFY
jgi:hypothetical protein